MTNKSTEAISIQKNLLWNSIGSIFYLTCQWAITVLVVLLSDNYNNSGVLAYAMAVGAIFGSIALFKVRTFQVSDVANQFSSSSYVAFRIITIAIAFVFCLVYLLATTYELSYLFATALYFLFKADEAVVDVFYGIEQKAERMDYIGKSQLIRGVLSLGSFCTVLAISRDINFAIIGMAISCMLVTFCFDRKKAKLFDTIAPSINKSDICRLFQMCSLAMVSSLLANSIVSVIRQYYGITHGEELLGIYAAIATPAILVQVAALYLYTPLIGLLAQTKHTKGMHAFKLQFLKILAFIIVVIAIIVSILSFLGEPFILFIFGNSLQPYVYIFPFVLISSGCIGLLFYVNDVLVILRSRYRLLLSNFLAIAIGIIGAFFLINHFGMNGVNYAIIIGSTAGFLVGLLCVCLNAEKR